MIDDFPLPDFYDVRCDECGTSKLVWADDMIVLWDEIERLGWLIGDPDDGAEHVCPECRKVR